MFPMTLLTLQTPEQVERISHLASFAEMKKIKNAFNYRQFLHPLDDTRVILKDGQLLRSGKAGESKTFFSGLSTERQRDKKERK